MEAIDLKLGKTLYGTKSTKPRWQKCLRLTNNCKISILTDLKKTHQQGIFNYKLNYQITATEEFVLKSNIEKSHCQKSDVDIFESCLDPDCFPQLVGSMYVKKHFDPKSRKDAEEMVDDFR